MAEAEAAAAEAAAAEAEAAARAAAPMGSMDALRGLVAPTDPKPAAAAAPVRPGAPVLTG